MVALKLAKQISKLPSSTSSQPRQDASASLKFCNHPRNLNPEVTFTSVDWVGAHDLISREREEGRYPFFCAYVLLQPVNVVMGM